jgi:hypothetical protein
MKRPWTCFRRNLILLALAIGPVALRADVIFNNITDAHTSALDVDGSSNQSFAQSFIPGGDYSMTSASVLVNAGTGTDSDFDLYLYSDSAGLPGTSVETLGTDLNTPPTGPACLKLGDCFGELTVDSFTPIDLTSGTTYWLVMTPYDSGSDVNWFEEAGGAVTSTAAGNAAGSDWSGVGTGPACRKLGTCLAGQFEIDGIATPEPSGVAFLTAGAILLIALFKRNRRAA